MFIHIGNVNYFVITDGKTIGDIFKEIFLRMPNRKISVKEKRIIMNKIKVQMNTVVDQA